MASSGEIGGPPSLMNGGVGGMAQPVECAAATNRCHLMACQTIDTRLLGMTKVIPTVWHHNPKPTP